MTTQILNIAFGETPVSFRADGFLNATAIAKHFGKLPKDYLKTEQTQEYIVALAEAMTERTKILTVENQLVIIKKGGNNKDEQGTWLHPKLAIHFARWLDPKFAVWCDFQIEKILGINQEQATDRLTDEQVGYLYNQVMRICGETGQAYQTVFGGLKRHFQVASYKHIKASDFAQACKWLGVPLPMEKDEKLSKSFDGVDDETLDTEPAFEHVRRFFTARCPALGHWAWDSNLDWIHRRILSTVDI